MKRLYTISLPVFCSLFIFLLFTGMVSEASVNELTINNESKTLVAAEGYSYTWFRNGEVIKGESGKELGNIESGHYAVEIADGVGNVTVQESMVAVTATGAIVKIYTIGDSTVSTYGSADYPRTGWGQVLQSFFNSANVQVVNKAVSGTSSKSFYNSYWTAVKNALVAGDFVFIQFGHNDSKNTTQDDIDNRYTDPSTTYKQYLTKYVNETKAKGAFPVFVTSMNRNWWKNGAIDLLPDYPPAMRELATSLNIPLVDLTGKSATLFNSLGQAYTTSFIFNNLAVAEYPNYPDGNADNTHFQEMGAIEMARLVVQGVSELNSNANVATLIPFLKPQYKITVAVNPVGSDVQTTRTAAYPAGLTVTLKTIPKTAGTFQKWNDASNTSIAATVLTKVTSGTVATSYAAIYKGAVIGVADCNNTVNGTAQLDNCDRCTGGTTGKTACAAVEEAETGACSFDGITETKNLGYKGSAYLNTDNVAGAGITFQVQAAAAGTATVSFRYATSADRPAQIILNGTTLPNILAFSNTGDFETWKAIDANVTFVKGNNTLVLSPTTAAGLANIDQLGYVSTGLSKGNCVITGMEEKENTTSSAIFPNPFTGSFRVVENGLFEFLVYDMTGSVVEQGKAINNVTLGNDLHKGLYIVKIKSGSESRLYKLTKN